ncbi:MAG: hypothetical protein OXP73_02085 [Chloroflexota bacterium]|nr:hypothetical protein [Chloroflexota bacterium]
MWIDVVTDGERYGPLRDILAWRQDETWNRGSRFAFTAMQKDAAVRIQSLSDIYAYSIVGGHVTAIGAGIVQDIEERPDQGQTTLSVSGVGFEAELLSRTGVDLEFSAASHATIVGALAVLLPGGWSLYPDPEIANDVLGLRLSATSLLSAVRKCAELFNTRLQFGFDRSIQMRTFYSPLEIVAADYPGLGAHIVHLTKKTSAKEITTVLTPFAADGKPRLSDATDAAPDGFNLNAAEGTLTNTAALARYGEWHKEHTFRALLPNDETLGNEGIANILLGLAAERLRLLGEPQETYTIVVQGMRQMIRPFHQLAVKVRDPYLDDSFRVASVSTTFDQEAGLQQTITVTTRQSIQHVDDLSLLARRLQDLFDATTFAVSANRQVYTGAARTSFSGRGGGGPAPVYFAANVGDVVRATFETDSPGAGQYEYAVNSGDASSLNLFAELDLSADINKNGTQTLTIDLSAVPREPIDILVRVIIS